MKYSLITPELNDLTTDIKRKIRLSMNGIVSDQMEKSGICYKLNYGVTIPRIKEIASGYAPNHDLAQHLWKLKIRETMIIATLLEPIDKFTIEMAHSWTDSFNQIEIIEQTNMNLFCKLPFANLLALEWIQSPKRWTQITGFILSARININFSKEEINTVINKGLELSVTDNLHLYKAVAVCFSRFCRIGKETASFILKETSLFSDSSLISQQYISNEVKQEILFLDIL